MSNAQPISISFDRRILEHPRAYHLRRMRAGLWVYLDLLARLPANADTLEVDPAAIAAAMGVSEGFIRSWLGHLNKAGYFRSERLNGIIRVTLRRDHAPEPTNPPSTRFFTTERLERALGEQGNRSALESALAEHTDAEIRRALAKTLSVPESQIRRSRTALFLYLLKQLTHA